MPEDITKLVQSLIRSNIGDAARLSGILENLQVGVPIGIDDEAYIKSLEGQLPQTAPVTGEAPVQDTPKTSEDISTAAPVDTPHTTRPTRSKKSLIIIASVIAAIAISYVAIDMYSVNELQFRPHSGNQYKISPTEIHIEADVCNPSIFPATFNRYEISAFYNSDLIEKADIHGATVSPKAMSTLDGVFALNAQAIFKLRQGNFTFDPTLAKITTTVDAPIFGAIPFSVVKQYTAQQFQDALKNGPPGSFDC